MLIFNYPSKKYIKENCIGKTLNYQETSLFGLEYRSTGELIGCNRPHITGHKREFFASVTLENDLIIGVK
tara:strand:+ start:363 stop:572 length:210 start_codon:yes stop_codon:yes gene_type:complete